MCVVYTADVCVCLLLLGGGHGSRGARLDAPNWDRRALRTQPRTDWDFIPELTGKRIATVVVAMSKKKISQWQPVAPLSRADSGNGTAR